MTTGRNLTITLLILAFLHGAIAIYYARITPYRQAGIISRQLQPDFGAPDERQHANYVQTLLDTGKLPVFKPDSPDLGEHYEDHQPPMFYAAAAVWAKVVGVKNVDDPGALALRYVNAVFGALTVLGVGLGSFWAFGNEKVPISAAGIVAFLPMFAALSGALSNDPLLFAFVTWSLALSLRFCQDQPRWQPAIGVGLLIGGACLTKTSGLILFPVLFALALCYKQHFRTIALAGVIGAMLSAPIWLRNQSLYGDPFAIKVFKQAFVGSPKTQFMIDNVTGGDSLGYWVNWFGWWTTRSFFGVFGYMDLFMNEKGSGTSGPGNPNTIYRLLTAVFAVSTIGWVVGIVKQNMDQKKIHAVLGVAFAITCLLYLSFNLTYFQAQARYLFPAIFPISLGLSFGWAWLLRERFDKAYLVLPLVLLGFNVYCMTRLPGDFELKKAPPVTQQP